MPPVPAPRPEPHVETALNHLRNTHAGPRYDTYDPDVHLFVFTLHPTTPYPRPRRLPPEQLPGYITGLRDAAEAVIRSLPPILAELPDDADPAALVTALFQQHQPYAAAHNALPEPP